MGKIIENYQLKEQLGEGVYAKVYKAVHLVTKQEVAIKVVQAEKFKEIPKLEQCTVNQINILSTLQNCPYIVKYIDMLKTANNFYFVYQYCNGGTLDKLMQRQGPLSEKKALYYFRQIVQAFKILSKSNIMHRDIKPDNILLHNGNIKIADFGFCKPLENALQMAQTMLGSPIYMAPQVLKGQIYTMKADIWSMGVVLFQMIYGKCPFQSKSIAKLIKMLEEEDVSIPEYPKISPTLEKLLRRILVKDYMNRIDWKEIFQYTITQTGEIYPPGNKPIEKLVDKPMMGLRQSLRSGPSYSSTGGINFSQSGSSLYTSSSNSNTSLSTSNQNFGSPNTSITNDSLKTSPITPKVKSAIEQMKNVDEQASSRVNPIMTKKSPMKDYGMQKGLQFGSGKSSGLSGNYGSLNGNSGGSGINNSPTLNSNSINQNNLNTNIKNQQFAKTDRSNRYQILLKSHSKLSTLNQMIIQTLKLQHNRSIYMAFLLFKSIQKQSILLNQSLRKQTLTDYSQQYKQFKLMVDKQLNQVKMITSIIAQCIQQQSLNQYGSGSGNNKTQILQSKRFELIKSYLQGIKHIKDDQLILTLQVIDYLDEGLLIKKDAYQKLTRDHLQRQLKYKLSKYNVDINMN